MKRKFKQKAPDTISLINYMELIEPTDRFKKEELQPILMGLFGEVGSVLSNYKKRRREKEAYKEYHYLSDLEEFGDVMWYFSAICRRFDIEIDSIFSDILSSSDQKNFLAAGRDPLWPITSLNKVTSDASLDPALLDLGETAANLLRVDLTDTHAKRLLVSFASHYIKALQAAQLSFYEVLRHNIKKTRGRFVKPDQKDLPKFDSDYEAEERIPDKFKIDITQRKSGKAYLQWKGVFIGDPLTDNIEDRDDYRFHDVFHLTNAAILHWSPVFRALIKHKRKSNPKDDEEQDSGRAIVVEEGLTAWIFSQAKALDFFEDPKIGVSFDMLKTIQQFVTGYEVEKCPLYLWEQAILEGYKVFRQVRKYNGGTIICDKVSRKVKFRPPEGNNK